MRDVGILVFLPDFFDLDRAMFIFKASPKDPALVVEPGSLRAIHRPTVVVDAAKLVAELKRGDHLPPTWLLDFSDALKLLNGVAKNDGGAKRNDAWRFVAAHARAASSSTVVSQVRELFNASVDWPESADGPVEQLTLFAEEVSSAWSAVCDALEAAGEDERYEQVEAPASQVFFERQSSGIGVDQDKLKRLLEVAERDKYVAYNELAEIIKASPSGLSARNVGPILAETDASHLSAYADAPNFEEYIRLAASESLFAETFYKFIRAGRDVRILASLQGGAGSRAYPEFQVMGTVTGRVLVSNPSLQHLRKDFRSILAPDRGKKLAYLDFAQFEPGILAHLSGDEGFIAAYNRADVYEELAIAMFGDRDKRPVAKRMFLSFCYGMSVERIVDLVGGEDLQERSRSFRAFVDRFPGLAAFRADAERQLVEDGYVGTAFGNRRYRTQAGQELSPAERRWPVSQAVQGTASLVFKEAVLALTARFGVGAVLLPVHDAVLMQFDVRGYKTSVRDAAELMRQAMATRCPTVQGRVVVAETF